MDAETAFDELLGRVRQGDAEAAAMLVQRYEPEVRRFVRYRLTTPRVRRLMDSLDICQSVFARFFARITDGRFELHDPQQLQKLLLTMAQNRLRDQLRKLNAQRRGGDAAAEAPADERLADRAAPPGQAVEMREIVDLVRERLSGEDRELLDRWMQGDDWLTLAAHAGGSSEAVRKRLTRAIDRAAQELGWGDAS
jgi:RNA polymerase sigma factor (sigma-70 family)